MITRSLPASHDVNIVGDRPGNGKADCTSHCGVSATGSPPAHCENPSGPVSPALTRSPHLANHLSPAPKHQVQQAVAAALTTGALRSRPRLSVDLLSRQPLYFNLLGPPAEDLVLATTG